MIKCEHCGTENDDRNYYCGWCGNLIKEMLVSKKYTEKYNYLFNLEIVEDDSRDIDNYAPYRSKKKNIEVI